MPEFVKGDGAHELPLALRGPRGNPPEPVVYPGLLGAGDQIPTTIMNIELTAPVPEVANRVRVGPRKQELRTGRVLGREATYSKPRQRFRRASGRSLRTASITKRMAALVSRMARNYSAAVANCCVEELNSSTCARC